MSGCLSGQFTQGVPSCRSFMCVTLIFVMIQTDKLTINYLYGQSAQGVPNCSGENRRTDAPLLPVHPSRCQATKATEMKRLWPRQDKLDTV